MCSTTDKFEKQSQFCTVPMLKIGQFYTMYSEFRLDERGYKWPTDESTDTIGTSKTRNLGYAHSSSLSTKVRKSKLTLFFELVNYQKSIPISWRNTRSSRASPSLDLTNERFCEFTLPLLGFIGVNSISSPRCAGATKIHTKTRTMISNALQKEFVVFVRWSHAVFNQSLTETLSILAK